MGSQHKLNEDIFKAKNACVPKKQQQHLGTLYKTSFKSFLTTTKTAFKSGRK
jgi:hypothetical protein